MYKSKLYTREHCKRGLHINYMYMYIHRPIASALVYGYFLTVNDIISKPWLTADHLATLTEVVVGIAVVMAQIR